MLLFTYAAEDIDLFVEYDKQIPAEIFSDQKRLGQVLINLVSNAVKYTRKGFVRVKAAQSDNDLIKVFVEDSGNGMTQEQIEKIFEPLGQMNKSIDSLGGGLGLALSNILVQKISCNREIRVESKLNEGSKFSFFIKNQQKKSKNLSHNRVPTFYRLQEVNTSNSQSKGENRTLEVQGDINRVEENDTLHQTNCPEQILLEENVQETSVVNSEKNREFRDPKQFFFNLSSNQENSHSAALQVHPEQSLASIDQSNGAPLPQIETYNFKELIQKKLLSINNCYGNKLDDTQDVVDFLINYNPKDMETSQAS